MADSLQPFRKKTGYVWNAVYIELTNACNFHCDSCPSDLLKRPRAGMPRSLWEKLLREIADKRLSDTVCFHQLGEPLINPEVFDAIEVANNNGLCVILFTNGMLLDESRSQRLLQSLKNGMVVVSLQNVRPEAFGTRSRNALTWNEYFERVKNFLVKADTQGLSVRVSCLVDVCSIGWNVVKYWKEQREIQYWYNSFARLLGGRSRWVNIINPMVSYPLGKKAALYVFLKCTWNNQFRPPGIGVVKNQYSHCSSIHDLFVVESNGRCTFCCCDYEGILDLGNALHSSLEEIFLGEKSQRIIANEANGRLIEEECQGRLINSKTGKLVPDRPFYMEYYYFRKYLMRCDVRGVARKAVENIRRRFLRVNA